MHLYVMYKLITQAIVFCLLYAHNARGHAAPEGECVYTRQSMSACVITNMLHLQHYKICPNLKSTAQLAYIVTNTNSDCGRYF